MSDDRRRVVAELASAWPLGGPAPRATPQRALALNAERVLEHCDAALRRADDARAVERVRAEASRSVRVCVWDARASRDRNRERGVGSALEGRVPASGCAVDEEAAGAPRGDAALVVCEREVGSEAGVSRDVVDDVRLSSVGVGRIVVVVERCAAGEAEATRERVARALGTPVENVFATYGVLRGSTRDVDQAVLKNPPRRSEIRERLGEDAREEEKTPASAFALDDDNDDDFAPAALHADDDERLSVEEWSDMLRDDATKCQEAAFAAVVAHVREICLLRAEKLALEYEPLRSALYARIRREASAERSDPKPAREAPKIRDAPRFAHKPNAPRSNASAQQPLGIDMIALQTMAINGVEQGANVASQVGEKVGSFLNWMVSDETEAERRRRVEQERVWQERRKQMWESQRSEREKLQHQQSQELQRQSSKGSHHSPTSSLVEGTASLVNKTAKLVDIIDGTLGADDLPKVPKVRAQRAPSPPPHMLEARLDQANERIRALEDALARFDPMHELLLSPLRSMSP